jgi:transcriptional repressor NrdR
MIRLNDPTAPVGVQGRGYRRCMRCPTCASLDDKVVDSRQADDGLAIRRRRECLGCGRRFTTFERIDEVGLVVVKRSGVREPFRRDKIVAGVRAAAKNRPVSAEQLEGVAADVEEALRLEGSEASSARVGAIVLERLRALDEVAYVRFASVYKGFEAPGDFEREVLALTQSDPPPPPPPPVD